MKLTTFPAKALFATCTSLGAGLLSQCATQQNLTNSEPTRITDNVTKIATVDTPGRCSEIISYSRSLKLLLATNSVSSDITVMSVPDLDSGNLIPIDLNKNKSGIQGLATDGEPTSVAVHPSKNIALAAVNARTGKGYLVAFDLKAAANGEQKQILKQEIGIHLDSIAISPDGRWAVVADEAEGDAKSEGAIYIVDLAGLGSGAKLKSYKVPNLATKLGRPAGRVEPEFVAIDGSSKFAVVTCQEDNAVVTISLSSNPQIRNVLKLAKGAEPDGANLIQHNGMTLLAVAEEGLDMVSIFKMDRENLSMTPSLLVKMNVRLLSGKGDRSDPEGVSMFKQGGRLYLAIAVERADKTVIMDITNPSVPRKVASVDVGSRPEGIIVEKSNGFSYILTGDEGKPGKGEVSVIRVK